MAVLAQQSPPAPLQRRRQLRPRLARQQLGAGSTSKLWIEEHRVYRQVQPRQSAKDILRNFRVGKEGLIDTFDDHNSCIDHVL